MTAFDQVCEAIADVEGWLTEGQARLLYDVAASRRTGDRIVEIGSFRGRSTIVLALAAPPDVEVITIDPHAGNDRGPQELAGYEAEAADDHRAFERNLASAGVRDRVTHLRAFSHEALDAVPGGVDVLFIDGAHRYGPARDDLDRWGAKVVDGGVMLVHDAFSSVGVTLALLRSTMPSRRFRYVGRVRSLAMFRADPARPRLTSIVRQLAQLPWFAFNVTLKVLITARVLRRTEWPY